MLVFAQPAFVYDGTSTVEFTGQYNWTIKYPLGGICEDLNWGKILTIDITARSKQADLIFAFGTQSEYFGVVIGWDTAIWVPLNNGGVLNEPKRIGAAFVTPPSGSPLQQALLSLEQQYARTIDFRDSLITGINQTKEWEMVVDDNEATNPFSKNGTQLVLDIRGDRRNQKTYLSMYKNGRNGSIEMGSTWGYGDDVFLYMGLDGIHDETFILSGIHSDDQCSWTARPTTAIPTQDTMEPTMTPSISPTDDTTAPSIDPTQDPTGDPTSDPTTDPITDPTSDPSADPTRDPTSDPTNDPSMEPTYTSNPSTDPTADPTNDPTADPTTSTSTTSTTDDSVDDTPIGDSDGYTLSCIETILFGFIVMLYTLR